MTIVKAANAAEFLALLPRMLGFRPARSLVLVPFAGTRSLGAMRFDLPDSSSDGHDSAAATIVGLACRVSDVDAIAIAVYTDAAFAGSTAPPHRDLVDALERRADACGLRVTDALVVATDGWCSYFDDEAPAGGRRLTELADADDGAAAEQPDPDQDAGAALPVVDAADAALVETALADLDRAVEAMCGRLDDERGARRSPKRTTARSDRIDPRGLAAVLALDDLPATFESALAVGHAELDAYETALLIWCLERPAVRDIALAQWALGAGAGDRALEAQLRWEEGEAYPAHLARFMWGEGDQPDAARLDVALRLTRRLAAAAPSAHRPGALGAAAWLAWALGRSTHAAIHARTALEIDPDHGLAGIVTAFVEAGHLPDWAFRRRGE